MAANKPVFPANPNPPQSQPGRLQATQERELGRVITDVRKMRDGRLAGYFSQAAAPTGGTFAQGDVVMNSDPSLTLSGTDQYFVWGWCYASEGSGTLTWAPIKIWSTEGGGGAGFTAASMTATNAGTGSGLYINNAAGELSFRTLKAGVNCSLSTSGNEVVIKGPSELTNGRVPFATTLGSLVDSSLFAWDNNNARLNLGGAATTAGNDLFLAKSTNGQVAAVVMNSNSGSAVYAGFIANNGSGANMAMLKTGSHFQTAGLVVADQNYMVGSSGSLILGTSGAADVMVVSGGTATTNLVSKFHSNRNVSLGTDSLTVSSSVGFVHIPSVAGAPVAVPVAITGYVPMCYDRTNNNFYIYNGGWKKVLLA